MDMYNGHVGIGYNKQGVTLVASQKWDQSENGYSVNSTIQSISTACKLVL